jgi:Domain of unknown function (DUF4390)
LNSFIQYYLIDLFKVAMKIKTYVTIITALLFVFQNIAFAQQAVLNNMSVANTRDHLLLYLNVQGAFTNEVEKAILSGVPTTFSFLIVLNRDRNLWMDEKIVEITVHHTIKYNNLKKEFVVSKSWEDSNSVTTQSFEEAKQLMSKVEGLTVLSLDNLMKGSLYKIRAKAELGKLTLPLYLHYILFFASLWDFKTDWQYIDFTY